MKNILEKIDEKIESGELRTVKKLNSDLILGVVLYMQSKGVLLSGIKDFLLKEFKVDVSLQTISRALKENKSNAPLELIGYSEKDRHPEKEGAVKHSTERTKLNESKLGVASDCEEEEGIFEFATGTSIDDTPPPLLQGYSMKRKKIIYVSDSPELENRLDELERKIERGDITNLIKIKDDLWRAYCARYEKSEDVRMALKSLSMPKDVPSNAKIPYMDYILSDKRPIHHLEKDDT